MRKTPFQLIWMQANRKASMNSTTREKFIGKPIVTVPEDLHRYLFNSEVPSTASQKPINIDLPPLRNENILEHFRILAEEQTRTYRRLLEEAHDFDVEKARVVMESIDTEQAWRLETGWTKYSFDGTIDKIDFPEDDILFFDVEVCVIEGNLPTLAIALGKDAWYGWCSARLAEDAPIPEVHTQENLIKLGDTMKERIVIGHNVGYDRARVAESYNKRPTKIRYMDTMSMSIPMFGMADHQQSLYEKNDLDPDKNTGWVEKWKDRVSKNSLTSVYAHLCDESPTSTRSKSVSKNQLRTNFVKGTMDSIRAEFQTLMTYCANDNFLCARIYHELWKKFTTRFPHPATLAGMLNMGNAYLPINTHWPKFYELNMRLCEEKKSKSARAIVRTAREVEETGQDLDWKIHDCWMWSQPWTRPKKYKFTDWYLKLFKSKTSALERVESLQSQHIVTKSSLVPLLFGLVYGPYPLMKMKSKGWGYLVPTARAIEEANADGPNIIELANDISLKASKFPFSLKSFVDFVEDQKFDHGDVPVPEKMEGYELSEGLVTFYQLEHPAGEGNVGDPLTKHFAKDLQLRVIRPTRFEDKFETVLSSIRATQFWTSYRERFHREMPIWYPEDTWKSELGDVMMRGSIAAPIVPAGTVSRRSVHKLWVTLTNFAEESVIGTGLKAMVQAPPGFKLVGADVDSQEQWLAALFGDANEEQKLPESKRVAGKTAFSNMMLAGSKSDNTDLHSVIANQLKISRNHAKTLNYARLYGSGERHAAKHLVRVGGMKQMDAEATARELFLLTRGESLPFRKLSEFALPLLEAYEEQSGIELTKVSANGDTFLLDYINDETINFENWVTEKVKSLTANVTEVIPRLYDDFCSTQNFFVGGYESATFNFLDIAASAEQLRTPILECQISDSLAKLPPSTTDAQYYDSRYKRSVMNWVVQSSAVDFLHLLLVNMQWLCQTYDIKTRFVISIHDEVRYLCEDAEAPRVALALQLSNLMVRAYISKKVGIPQLPLSIAFFSQVDCDTVLRKEVDFKCMNPDGTIIPDGVAWTIDETIELTRGSLKLQESKNE